jgi:hypothetical protein
MGWLSRWLARANLRRLIEEHVVFTYKMGHTHFSLKKVPAKEFHSWETFATNGRTENSLALST